MKAYRLQITIKNEELFKMIMSIPKTQRGQFISMALQKYIKSTEGAQLLSMFATHLPNIAVSADLAEGEDNSNGNLNDITGDFL
ncbi:hypothetical protein Dacet_0666 [Denitrovibrio acetiphilus DSM 12809]|jgi:hypothetical protein|uniref:Uncharacterized protein n=1 Tax=Denitrovibrio acetiphilus (strain DSM 12809 / NBRC 114555 / N2460) TaxID=522772 RepID=D4H4R0_DENA2|nr:hypothetical protein [Denitrovibrio acetiphilus]ADD67454.1 hypothetical protein Dacet_0666 [Denitrovibrio acetiphilus DSM 12809]